MFPRIFFAGRKNADHKKEGSVDIGLRIATSQTRKRAKTAFRLVFVVPKNEFSNAYRIDIHRMISIHDHVPKISRPPPESVFLCSKMIFLRFAVQAFVCVRYVEFNVHVAHLQTSTTPCCRPYWLSWDVLSLTQPPLAQQKKKKTTTKQKLN